MSQWTQPTTWEINRDAATQRAQDRLQKFKPILRFLDLLSYASLVAFVFFLVFPLVPFAILWRSVLGIFAFKVGVSFIVSHYASKWVKEELDKIPAMTSEEAIILSLRKHFR